MHVSLPLLAGRTLDGTTGVTVTAIGRKKGTMAALRPDNTINKLSNVV
jgi:hypothetical protein